MNLDHILSILGILIPIIVTLIFQWLKNRKGKMYYIEEMNINLYDDIVKQLSDITILYNNQQVSKNLILIKGFYFYDAQTDVQESNIQKNVTISVRDEGATWKAFSILDHSEDLNPKYTYADNEITFVTTGYSKGDFVRFQGLLEANSNNVRLRNRIFNVSSTMPKESLNLLKQFGYRGLTFLVVLAVYIFVLISSNTISFLFPVPKDKKTVKEYVKTNWKSFSSSEEFPTILKYYYNDTHIDLPATSKSEDSLLKLKRDFFQKEIDSINKLPGANSDYEKLYYKLLYTGMMLHQPKDFDAFYLEIQAKKLFDSLIDNNDLKYESKYPVKTDSLYVGFDSTIMAKAIHNRMNQISSSRSKTWGDYIFAVTLICLVGILTWVTTAHFFKYILFKKVKRNIPFLKSK